SGIGGAPKYGVVSQLPVVEKVPHHPPPDLSISRSAPDQAEVGRYGSSLANGVSVHLAASDHAGLLSYQFPRGSEANVVVNASHFLASHRGFGFEQHYVRANISLVHGDNGLVSYEGDATLFIQNPNPLIQTPENNVQSVGSVGAVFTFDEREVKSTVGISWISSAKACRFADEEIPPGTTVEDLAAAAKANWNTQVFSKIKPDTEDIEALELLYTSLYGMHLMPTNRTGENPKWESAEPYYDDFVSMWDLFRCSTSLMQILQPVAFEEQIRALIDIWRHDGYMPDGRSSNYNGRTQGGSNVHNVLADAFIKSVQGAVNWDDGFKAMVKGAEIPPESSNKEGRGAAVPWAEQGFILNNYSRSVTRAVEYAVNDFALYQVAKGLYKQDDAAKYFGRSRNWQQHWNPNASALGFEGFVVPRSEEGGAFVNQDPLSCGHCYWDDDYYQGLPWEYSFNPHHDMAALIGYMGGDDRFIGRLNTTFAPNMKPDGNTIFNPGNQPSFTTPYLYHFAGRQDLSVKQSRYIAKTHYKPGRSGLPGNSDSGSMQTWLLWNMIGLYPLTGQSTFLIGSPWFGMSIDLGDGKTLNISTKGKGDYVQSLKVNGEEWGKNWVTWDDVFKNGGTMEFVLDETASNWSWCGERPPSPASELENGELEWRWLLLLFLPSMLGCYAPIPNNNNFSPPRKSKSSQQIPTTGLFTSCSFYQYPTMPPKRKQTPDMPQSPPKRVTRARAKKEVDSKPETTRVKTASARVAATKKKTVATIQDSDTIEVRHDNLTDNPHEDAMTEEPVADPPKTRGKAKSTPNTAAAKSAPSKTPSTTAPAKATRSRSGKTVASTNTAEQPPKQRGRAKRTAEAEASVASETTVEEIAEAVNTGPPAKATRGRPANNAPTRPVTTRTRAAAAAPKKRVKFDEHAAQDKENQPLVVEGQKKPEVKATGLRAKPIRKPAGPKGGAKATKAAKQETAKVEEDASKSHTLPLSPKK
ncbi:MAG: hypothetical protein Q9169_008268, partial [Polycauliona sp. 2 TL-2023]